MEPDGIEHDVPLSPYTPCMPYMPTLTPLAPPQLIGIYGSPMERLDRVLQVPCGSRNVLRLHPRLGPLSTAAFIL